MIIKNTQVNPPYYVPLVEIVPAPWTRPDIPEKTKAIMTEIGQKPVVFSREIDGFALNRIQYVIGYCCPYNPSLNNRYRI